MNTKKTRHLSNEYAEHDFDKNQDLMVFLHIQKTGGSDFDRHVVKYLQEYNPVLNTWTNMCTRRPIKSQTDGLTKISKTSRAKVNKYPKYTCSRESKNNATAWYFSRQTFGWACGLHADLTRLRYCVQNVYRNSGVRNYVIISIIRDPVKRYISEWMHIMRGATWSRSKNACNRERNGLSQSCFGNNQINLSLTEFLSSCESHVSKNRMVKWFADYNETANGCAIFAPNQSRILLHNAQENLVKLKYFAITEYQHLSQKLFEAQFRNLRFSKPLSQSDFQYADDYLTGLNQSNDILNSIKAANSLDIEFYEYALKLFFNRLKYYKLNNNVQ